MKPVDYAIILETQVAKMLENMPVHTGQITGEIHEALVSHQINIITILKKQSLSKGEEIEISLKELWPEEKSGQQPTTEAGIRPENMEDIAKQLCLLWTFKAYYEQLSQLYRQASHNTTLPREHYFFSSLAEVKLMIKRRLDAAIRSLANEVWGHIGFAPFILGKD